MEFTFSSSSSLLELQIASRVSQVASAVPKSFKPPQPIMAKKGPWAVNLTGKRTQFDGP
jgi:hypothetical protein